MTSLACFVLSLLWMGFSVYGQELVHRGLGASGSLGAWIISHLIVFVGLCWALLRLGDGVKALGLAVDDRKGKIDDHLDRAVGERLHHLPRWVAFPIRFAAVAAALWVTVSALFVWAIALTFVAAVLSWQASHSLVSPFIAGLFTFAGTFVAYGFDGEDTMAAASH